MYTPVPLTTFDHQWTLIYFLLFFLELEIPSLQVPLKEIIPEEDIRQARIHQLEHFDKMRLHIMEHLKSFHKKIKRAYENKIQPKEF